MFSRIYTKLHESFCLKKVKNRILENTYTLFFIYQFSSISKKTVYVFSDFQKKSTIPFFILVFTYRIRKSAPIYVFSSIRRFLKKNSVLYPGCIKVNCLKVHHAETFCLFFICLIKVLTPVD